MLLVTLAALFALSACSLRREWGHPRWFERRVEVGLMRGPWCWKAYRFALLFLAEALLLALIGRALVGFRGRIDARAPDRPPPFSIRRFLSKPVLFPIILAIAVFVTFAGSGRRDQARGEVLIPAFRHCEGKHERLFHSAHAAGKFGRTTSRKNKPPQPSMLVRMLIPRRRCCAAGPRCASAFVLPWSSPPGRRPTAMDETFTGRRASKLRTEFRNYGG